MPSVLGSSNFSNQIMNSVVVDKNCNQDRTQRVRQFKFNSLPAEVQLDIFGRVNQMDRVTKLPLVCKHWECILRQPCRAWREFMFAPTFFRNDSNYQLSRWNAAKDAVNYYKLMSWLRERIEGMKVIKLSDRFGSNENCKRMYDALLNNLPYATELESLSFSFKSPLVTTYFLPQAQPYLQSILSLKLETWNISLSPHNLSILAQLPTLKFLTIGALYGYGDSDRQPVLDGFPMQILTLTNLEELHIRSRGVIVVPRQIAQLQNLKVLDMECCLVSSLPGSMINMPNMREISLAKNRVQEHVDEILDVLFSIPGLEKLDLSSNQIHKMPNVESWFSSTCAESYQLKEINLSQNYLSQLPETFSNLQKLESLDLSKNQFEYIPNVLVQLQNLKRVDFSQCRQLQALDLTRPALIRQGCDVKLPIHILNQSSQQSLGGSEIEDWGEISGFAINNNIAEGENNHNQGGVENLNQRRSILRQVSDVVSGFSSLSKSLSQLIPSIDIPYLDIHII